MSMKPKDQLNRSHMTVLDNAETLRVDWQQLRRATTRNALEMCSTHACKNRQPLYTAFNHKTGYNTQSPSDADASRPPWATVLPCALKLSTPSALSFSLSLFLSEDWTVFCSQGSETQAVSAGNIFHSPGLTGALAATRYGSFQSLVLLGKYGSLWTGPLCRLRGVGKDKCRWWRHLIDIVWQ